MAEVHPKTLWDQAYNRSGTLPKHRTVLNALRTWANPQTLRCFAKLEDIAEWTGLSTSACWRQIKTNEAAGWIEIVHQGHSGGKANEYRLLNPGVHARVSQGTANENPSVHAMNPSVHARETLASTHNQLGIKEIPKGISKGEENPSVHARDGQDLHSAKNSPRVGPPREADPWGSALSSGQHTEPRRGEVQGDYNPSVDARVSVASTQRPWEEMPFESPPGRPEPSKAFFDPFAD